MKVQLLIASIALGVCVGMPVKPEPRKFVYQVGYPSVRRYPVYPDRLFNPDQAQMLVKMAADKNMDIKNELMSPEVKKSETMPLMKPELVQPEENSMAGREEETSTLSFQPVETELTTTYRPVTTPEVSSPSTTTTGSASTTPSGFFFTPKPSSIQSESSVSSSSSFSSGPTSPVLTIIASDAATPAEPPAVPFQFFGDNVHGDNSLLPQPLHEDPVALGPIARDPVALGPIARDPVALGPIARDPVALGPIARDPVALGPIARDPVAFGPIVQDPVAIGPIAGDPVALGPIAGNPVALGPIARDPVSSSFAVFTEAPEESTDTPMTTALPRNEFMEQEQEEEERMSDPTTAPQEVNTEEILEELPESNTDVSLLEQTVTDATWDPVTQDIYTTEEIETF